jgi:hypothetical protein
MSLTNKILAAGLACGMAFSMVGTAAAAADATSKANTIIFRIENIKPLKNDEGITDRCEFYITAYNRMDREIKEAELLLSWTDDVSGRYKISNGNLEVEGNAEKAKTVISHKAVLNNIGAHAQKSFKNVVDTDKCFLLFDKVDYKVSTCIAEGDNIKVKNNKRIGDGSCRNAFDYVNSQNPEYYSEFKDIPESELAKMAEEEKHKDAQVIDGLFKQSMETIEQVSKTLSEIK